MKHEASLIEDQEGSRKQEDDERKKEMCVVK